MMTFEKPRFLVVGDKASFVKSKTEPQEDALRRGEPDELVEEPQNFGTLISVMLISYHFPLLTYDVLSENKSRSHSHN
jgi:hypothetical protein